MKIKGKIKDGMLHVKASVFLRESIEQEELQKFAAAPVRGFMRPKVIKRMFVEYTGPTGISLYEYLQKPITRYDFFFIIEQILVYVQELQRANYSLDKTVTNVKNVYINEVTKEMQFIYLPTSIKRTSINVIELLESIIYLVQPAQGEDTGYVSQFVYFLKGLKVNDIEVIEEYIYNEEENVVHIIRGQEIVKEKPEKKKADNSRRPTSSTRRKSVPYRDPNETVSEIGETLGEDSGTISRTQTRYRGQERKLVKQFPKLVHSVRNESIEIDKATFRIGRDSEVDYDIADNPSVSHCHANIIRRGNRYFIMDLKSKNGTYVNDEQLSSQQEKELQDGDVIVFSDEEFVFKL